MADSAIQRRERGSVPGGLAKALLVMALVSCSSGCGYLTHGLRQVGRRYESAAWAGDKGKREYGCVEAAWTDEAHSRLCVKFKTTDGKRVHTRYLNLEESQIEMAGGWAGKDHDWWDGVKVEKLAVAGLRRKVPVLSLYQGFVEARASRRAKWDTSSMKPLLLLRGEGNPPTLKGGDSLRVVKLLHPPTKVCFVMDCPGGGYRRAVVFEIHGRPYRTGWGRAAQALLPVTVAVDIVTMPIQFPIAASAMCQP